jgi:hypothetical protein
MTENLPLTVANLCKRSITLQPRLDVTFLEEIEDGGELHTAGPHFFRSLNFSSTNFRQGVARECLEQHSKRRAITDLQDDVIGAQCSLPCQ